MIQPSRRALAPILATIGAGLAAAAAAGSPPLPPRVEQVLHSQGLPSSAVSIVVRDAVTGESYLELNAREPRSPASTIKVLTTFAALDQLGPSYQWMVGLHKASFIVWFGVTAIHVLAYLPRIPRLAAADWRGGDRLGGSLGRRAAVGVSLGLGVALAVVTLPDAQAWMGHLNHH